MSTRQVLPGLLTRTSSSWQANIDGTNNDNIRADMVFFETANGGAVFSVSSINWFSGLSHNGYDNNVSRITSNVLENFLA